MTNEKNELQKTLAATIVLLKKHLKESKESVNNTTEWLTVSGTIKDIMANEVHIRMLTWVERYFSNVEIAIAGMQGEIIHEAAMGRTGADIDGRVNALRTLENIRDAK